MIFLVVFEIKNIVCFFIQILLIVFALIIYNNVRFLKNNFSEGETIRIDHILVNRCNSLIYIYILLQVKSCMFYISIYEYTFVLCKRLRELVPNADFSHAYHKLYVFIHIIVSIWRHVLYFDIFLMQNIYFQMRKTVMFCKI